jgi:hypothetical protein
MRRSFRFEPVPGRPPGYWALIGHIHAANPKYDWERHMGILLESDQELADLAEAALRELPPEQRAALLSRWRR